MSMFARFDLRNMRDNSRSEHKGKLSRRQGAGLEFSWAPVDPAAKKQHCLKPHAGFRSGCCIDSIFAKTSIGEASLLDSSVWKYRCRCIIPYIHACIHT